MIGYLVTSWNPWDCQVLYKKIFLSRREALIYTINYNLKIGEELTIEEVEIGD